MFMYTVLNASTLVTSDLQGCTAARDWYAPARRPRARRAGYRGTRRVHSNMYRYPGRHFLEYMAGAAVLLPRIAHRAGATPDDRHELPLLPAVRARACV